MKWAGFALGVLAAIGMSTSVLAQTSGWFSAPPISSSSSQPTCSAAGQWLLLYWGGPSTPIGQAAPLCNGANRFWSNQGGRWLGFNPAAVQASDTWTVSTGEAAFVGSVAGGSAAAVLPSPSSGVPTVTQPSTSTPSATTTLKSFGDGTHQVPQQVSPGTYRNLSSGCYWERLKGFGGTINDILANDNTRGPAIVTIKSGDIGFTSRRCGTWTEVSGPITKSPTDPFSDGQFIIGLDIAPGTWRTDGTDSCYWARLSGFGGNVSDILANDNPRGPALVTISPTDTGFESSRCGTWMKVNP
jgi:hypothetical protein